MILRPAVSLSLLAVLLATAAAQQSTLPATQPMQQQATVAQQPDRAEAYYHYSLARNYEELAALYGRSEYATKAIEQYKLAIKNDPGSEFLNAGLAELYAKTNRIRDAVLEAQAILQRDPKNVEARKLLGRIYLRSLGDTQAGTQSQEILKLAIEQYEHIVRIEPKAVDGHLLLGRLYMLNKDLRKAEEAFKTALKLQPDSEEGVTNLAYLYNEQGEGKKAAAVLSAVPDAARTSKLYLALGYTYEQQHVYKQAIDAYKKALEIDPENLDAMRGLAQNLLNDGQTELALKQYQAIIQEDPQDAQAQLRIAEIQRRTGKLDAALESLKKAEGIVQDSLEVPYNFALVYTAQGRYEDAVATLQKLLERTAKADGKYATGEANNRAVFLERLAGVYREMGRPQQAIETYRKMFELGDENAARAYQQIVDTHRDAKQWQLATAAAEEGSAKFPNDRNLKLMWAGQLADSGQQERGIELAKSLLNARGPDRENREVQIALSQIYSRLRMWKEAEEAAEQALKLSPTDEEKQYMAFIEGAIYERQKKYDEAEERFRHVLAADPDNAMALNYLGYMFADRGVRLDEAVTLVRKALDTDPQNGAYLDSLGWAYFKQGKYELAEENLRKAVAKNPNDATLHDHLGDLFHKTGRLKLAAMHWERALEEWGKSVAADKETEDVNRTAKKLDSAKVKLAKQQTALKQ